MIHHNFFRSFRDQGPSPCWPKCSRRASRLTAAHSASQLMSCSLRCCSGSRSRAPMRACRTTGQRELAPPAYAMLRPQRFSYFKLCSSLFHAFSRCFDVSPGSDGTIDGLPGSPHVASRLCYPIKARLLAGMVLHHAFQSRCRASGSLRQSAPAPLKAL